MTPPGGAENAAGWLTEHPTCYYQGGAGMSRKILVRTVVVRSDRERPASQPGPQSWNIWRLWAWGIALFVPVLILVETVGGR